MAWRGAGGLFRGRSEKVHVQFMCSNIFELKAGDFFFGFFVPVPAGEMVGLRGFCGDRSRGSLSGGRSTGKVRVLSSGAGCDPGRKVLRGSLNYWTETIRPGTLPVCADLFRGTFSSRVHLRGSFSLRVSSGFEVTLELRATRLPRIES